MSNPQIRITIDELKESLNSLEEKNLSELIDGLITLLNLSVAGSDVENEGFSPPEPQLIKQLIEAGFDIDEETHEILDFKDLRYKPRHLEFLRDVSLAVNVLNRYIKVLGVDRVASFVPGKNNLLDRKDRDFEKKKALANECQIQFINLQILLWTKYIFVRDGKLLHKGEAITDVINTILTLSSSPLIKWYSPAISNYLVSFRNGVAAAFSAWLALSNHFTQLTILPASSELDMRGVDFVGVNSEGKAVRYYQVKTMIGDSDEGLKIFNSKKDTFERDPGLIQFINENTSDNQNKNDSLFDQMAKIEETAKEDKVPWSWVFVTPDYSRKVK